jgi:hypothetical protein
MSADTILNQARTVIHRMVTQHMMVRVSAFGTTSLDLFEDNESGTRESRASIYLNSEQWAELSATADVMAHIARKYETEHPDHNKGTVHLNNQQVEAEQQKVRDQRLATKIQGVLTSVQSLAADKRPYTRRTAATLLDHEAVELLVADGQLEWQTKGRDEILVPTTNKNLES